jgi:TPR repeat protein
MITSNRFVRTYLFGSKVARIHNKSFQCGVSTAKEGLFEKQSTIILEPKIGNTVGAAAAGLRICGKVIYSPTLRKSDRFQSHDAIAKTLDALGEEGCTLEEALEQIFADLKRRGIAAETVNVAADQGQTGAQFNPGMGYTNGEGVSQDDFTQAAVLCREVAEQGYPKAQLMLGELYDSGDGVPQDYAQAAFWYRKAAEQGDADAQFNLGRLYHKGRGVPRDDTQSAFWFRKAAEQGNAEAQYLLGLRYALGDDVAQDYTQAAVWYRKAAEQGVAGAQFKLGLSYKDGRGVPQDDMQSAFWFRKAADRGDAEAQLLLGLSYYLGLGVPQDFAQTYFWLDLAAAGKLDASNMEQVAKFRARSASHLTPNALAREHERARKWFEGHQAKPPESGENGNTHQGVPQVPVTAPETLSEPEKHVDGEPPRLRGVGGWLLLFCIVTTIIAPLAHIADAAKSNDTVVTLIDVSFTILAFCAGLSVWRVRRHAFRWVRAYLIMIFCLGIATYVLSLGQVSDISVTIAELIATRINRSQTVGSVIAAVMWWQYFKKSKRVNATFGRNL